MLIFKIYLSEHEQYTPTSDFSRIQTTFSVIQTGYRLGFLLYSIRKAVFLQELLSTKLRFKNKQFKLYF